MPKRRWALALVALLGAGTILTAFTTVQTGPVAAVAPPAIPLHLTLSSRKVRPTSTPSATVDPTATPSAGPVATPAPILPPQPVRAPFPFEAGVNVLVYGNDPAFASKAAAQLDHLAQLHVNSVSFVFPIYTASWTATDVYADPSSTPSFANIRTFIRAAHQRHMRVMLRPLMDESSLHPAGKWRGQIAPSSIDAWFASYDSLMMGYAQLAQSEHAESIDIGTEFDSLQSSPGWLNLVAVIRRVYSGQLTYSANWAIQYPAFGWALDFLSIDAFFPLAVPANATQQQLVAAWSPWIARANGFAYNFGRHVVFTELGTTSEVGSFRTPWLWSHGTGLSLEAQRLYYAAACQTLKGRISGMYWWEYLIDPLPSPTTATDYDPQGKLADVEIGRCYA